MDQELSTTVLLPYWSLVALNVLDAVQCRLPGAETHNRFNLRVVVGHCTQHSRIQDNAVVSIAIPAERCLAQPVTNGLHFHARPEDTTDKMTADDDDDDGVDDDDADDDDDDDYDDDDNDEDDDDDDDDDADDDDGDDDDDELVMMAMMICAQACSNNNNIRPNSFCKHEKKKRRHVVSTDARSTSE